MALRAALYADEDVFQRFGHGGNSLPYAAWGSAEWVKQSFGHTLEQASQPMQSKALAMFITWALSSSKSS
jgi:hypothetical protein